MTDAEGTLEVRLGPARGAVVDRVVAALAARADLPIDRLADAQLAANAVCAGAQGHGDPARLRMRLTPDDAGLTIVIGPVAAGRGRDLVRDAAVPGVENVIERLADDHRVESAPGGGDLLVLRFARPSDNGSTPAPA